MKQFNHTKEIKQFVYTPYTQDEFTAEIIKHNPKELFLKAFSGTKPFVLLKDYLDQGCYYLYTASPKDSEFRFTTYENLYKLLKHYLTPSNEGQGIEFEEFTCYEIHTVQSRMYGCDKQCKECSEQQNNSR